MINNYTSGSCAFVWGIPTKVALRLNSSLLQNPFLLLALFFSLVLMPLVSAAATPNAPCLFGTVCATTLPPSTGATKWHPGHYMQMMRGDSDAVQANRFKYYDQIATNQQIVGVVVPFRWSQLETSRGDYESGIALVRAEIEKLKSLAVPKRLFIRMNDHNYGGNCPSTSYIPQYISDEGGTFKTNNGCNWRRWNATFMGYYVDMLRAYGAAFADEDYLEGIVVLRETSLAWGGSTPPEDYSDSAYRTQLDRLMTQVVPAFPRSIVSSPTNWVVSPRDTDQHIAHVATIGGAAGNMDTCPDCNQWADKTIRGDSGGVSYAGIIPIVYSVEASEMGLDSVGPEGGYTPEQLLTWANQSQYVTHLFWDRHNFGTTEQQWATGILPYISDSNNALKNTGCPSAIAQGCDSD